MTQVPTAEQHRALLSDCWGLARALPGSVCSTGPAGRIARSASNGSCMQLRMTRSGCSSTSEEWPVARQMASSRWWNYNRLDLLVETLIIDESKVYAPLFTTADRAAARAKLARQTGHVEELSRDRANRSAMNGRQGKRASRRFA